MQKMIKYQRIIAFDYLRLFLMVIVIAYHALMIYALPQSFFYHELTSNILTRNILSFFNCVNQTYFMGLYFFIAGFLTLHSVDRHGWQGFLRLKTIRIIPAIIVFSLIINPLMIYIGHLERSNIFYFFLNIYTDVSHYNINLHPGPLWFTQTLLLFYFLDYLSDKYFKKITHEIANFILLHHKIVGYLFLPIMITSTYLIRSVFPIGSVFLNFSLPYSLFYLFTYFLGVFVSKYNLLMRLIGSQWKWFSISLICILIWPVIVYPGLKNPDYQTLLRGGLNLPSLEYTAWEIITGISISIALISFFFKNTPNGFSQILKYSNDIYLTMIIHIPVVNILGVSLGMLDIASIYKYIILTILSIFLSFIISHLINGFIVPVISNSLKLHI